ncbi:MAG: ribosome-associated translation inhibitor RaiA [Mariprofundaceae bacterium]
MQVSITGRHVDLTDPLKDYVNDKLQHLKHSFDHVLDVHVVLSVEKFRQRCEVNMQANGINIHGGHETEDMYASIDGVVDKLNRQLKRYRSKLRKNSGRRKEGREIKVSHRILDLASEKEELAEDHKHEALHHEHTQALLMTVDEAVMQMELNEKQNVLLFINADTDSLNAVYRRSNGSMSWIEPETA